MAQVVNFDKMNVGRRGSGKHWTREEVSKRQVAAQKYNAKRQKIEDAIMVRSGSCIRLEKNHAGSVRVRYIG